MMNENCPVPQCESVKQVIKRIEEFIQYILGEKCNTVLAVTHSGFLYALYKFITNSPLHLKTKRHRCLFPNGCLVELLIHVKMEKITLELNINNNKYCKDIYH